MDRLAKVCVEEVAGGGKVERGPNAQLQNRKKTDYIQFLTCYFKIFLWGAVSSKAQALDDGKDS